MHKRPYGWMYLTNIAPLIHVTLTSALAHAFYNTGSRPLPAALHTSTQSTLLDDPPDVGTFAFAFTFSFHSVTV